MKNEIPEQVVDNTSDDLISNSGRELYKASLCDDKEIKVIEKIAEKLERRLLQDEFYKHFNPTIIKLTFFNIFLSNVFINVDHGSLPGCS